MRSLSAASIMLLSYAARVTAAADGCNSSLFNPPAQPTSVYIQISTISVQKLDTVDSSFTTDFYMNLAWQDDRLSSDQEFDPACMWAVQPDFTNALGDFGLDEADTSIQAGPPAWTGLGSGHAQEVWVTVAGRKQGQFAAKLQLQEFPFDYQIAQIVLETTATNDAAVFIPAPNIQHGIHPGALVIDGWDIESTGFLHSQNYYAALEETYDRMTIYFTLQRQSVYYTSRIVVNIILMVIMAGLVPFLRATEGDRLGFVQGSFLGIVSWVFVVSSSTPAVSYNTRLDTFINASFGAVFVLYVYNSVHAGYFKSIDRWTGRPTDDHKDDDDVEKTTSNPLPYTPIPYVATSAATPSAVTGATAAAERPAVTETSESTKSSIRCCFCSHGGKWSTYNVHRKLDLTVSLTVMVCYFIAIGAVLLPPVSPPTI